MSVSISHTKSQGFTAVEVMAAVVISGIVLATFFVFSFAVLSNTVRNSHEAQLAVESQSILRSITEELRLSSGIRTVNTITDPSHPTGWTTSNPDLVLIIATPVLDQPGMYVEDEIEGTIHQNEIVYFADEHRLYKRILAKPGVTENRLRTSCATANETCPQDILLSNHFEDMSFVFYDQDSNLTNDPTSARSIVVDINLKKEGFRQTTKFNNKIRITMRNNQT